MSNVEGLDILIIVVGIMLTILLVLIGILVALKIREKNASKPKTKPKDIKQKNNREKVQKDYVKQSIFDFMEFDTITDNMIVQKNGKRYLMILECQGINFDLMSELEKNSVEAGFIQFLNSLRYPIQIYVQTRTVNLGGSISKYKERVDDIAKKYREKQGEYNQKTRSGQYTESQLSKDKMEVTRLKNLYEYSVDIVNNTERMSLNKNILSKRYYIIIPYYVEENPDVHYSKEEVANIAFSELYTKAQTVINLVAVCGITSKILDSVELAELLYVAYNRDESEIFDLKRALNSGYEDLYSTAPDVYEKRIKALDKKIEEEAIKEANNTIYEVLEENENKRKAQQMEADLDDLISQMAQEIISQNIDNIGFDVANQANEKIEEKITKRKTKKDKKSKEEEEEKDEKKQKTTRRRTRTI